MTTSAPQWPGQEGLHGPREVAQPTRMRDASLDGAPETPRSTPDPVEAPDPPFAPRPKAVPDPPLTPRLKAVPDPPLVLRARGVAEVVDPGGTAAATAAAAESGGPSQPVCGGAGCGGEGPVGGAAAGQG